MHLRIPRLEFCEKLFYFLPENSRKGAISYHWQLIGLCWLNSLSITLKFYFGICSRVRTNLSLLQACCAWSFCSCWCWRLIFCTLVLTTCRTMAYSSFSRLYFFRRAYSSRPLQAAMRLAHRVAACVDFAVRCCFWLGLYFKSTYHSNSPTF